MIIEFRFKNILSFKDWTVLDFRASKDKKMGDYGTVSIGKENLCKMITVYGANASGKTNLLKVFDSLKSVIISDRKDKEEKINIYPFLLNDKTKNEPSEFEILFYSNDIKYFYRLKVDSNQIHYELLEYYPSVKPKMIFERKTENGVSSIVFNKDLKIDEAVKKEIEAKCLKNLSFLKAYRSVNIEEELIENAINFLNSFYPFYYSLPYFLSNLGGKDLFNTVMGAISSKAFEIYKADILEFLKNADFNIQDLIFEQQDLKVENTTYPISILKSFLHKVKSGDKYELKEIPLSLQSEGTKKAIYFYTILLNMIKNQSSGVISVDEIENSIHPLLLKQFIKKILQTNSKIQLVLTTHYDPLLEWDEIIRKDFIWFTSKKEDGSTELYPLTDFNGLNRISNLKKAYIYGNFGAVPDIKEE